MTVKNKDNSTGDISIIYDNSIKVKEFFQNYNTTTNSSRKEDVIYKLSKGNSFESNSSILMDAINIWYNNTSLYKSAYQLEIDRGTKLMTLFPERIITIDEEKTVLLKKELEKSIEKEQLRKEKEKQLKQEIQAAKEKFETEREQAELKKRKEFEQSDYYQILKEIKINFTVWSEKTQYETDQEYNSRINNDSETRFQNSIEKAKNNSINEFLDGLYYGQLQEYNADNESFEIYFYKYTSNSSINTQQYDTVIFSCPKNLAPQLKKYQKQNIFSYTYAVAPYLLLIPQDITMVDNNWEITDAIIVVGNACKEKAMIIEEHKGKYYANCYAKSFIDPKLSFINNYKIKLEKFEDLKLKSKLPNEFYFNWSKNISKSDFKITQDDLKLIY